MLGGSQHLLTTLLSETSSTLNVPNTIATRYLHCAEEHATIAVRPLLTYILRVPCKALNKYEPVRIIAATEPDLGPVLRRSLPKNTPIMSTAYA